MTRNPDIHAKSRFAIVTG